MANTIRNRTVSSSDFLAAAYFAVGWTSEKNIVIIYLDFNGEK